MNTVEQLAELAGWIRDKKVLDRYPMIDMALDKAREVLAFWLKAEPEVKYVICAGHYKHWGCTGSMKQKCLELQMWDKHGIDEVKQYQAHSTAWAMTDAFGHLLRRDLQIITDNHPSWDAEP